MRAELKNSLIKYAQYDEAFCWILQAVYRKSFLNQSAMHGDVAKKSQFFFTSHIDQQFYFIGLNAPAVASWTLSCPLEFDYPCSESSSSSLFI